MASLAGFRPRCLGGHDRRCQLRSLRRLHRRASKNIEEHQLRTLKTSKIPTEVELEVFKEHVQSLVMMYGTGERSMKDLQAFSFDVAKGRQADLQKLEFSNPPDDATQWPPLSPGEQVRLQ